MSKHPLILALLLSAVMGLPLPRVGLLDEAPAKRPALAQATGAPVQLTTGGCCTQPYWSQDSKQVLYIDKPAGGKLGIYGVAVAAPNPAPVLVSQRIEDTRIVGPYRIETTQTTTTLVRLSDGKKFNVPAQGRSVQFAPDFKRIAWSITNQDLTPEQQVAAIWVANVDGTGAKRLTTLRRGGVGGWISNDALLINGQDPNNRLGQILYSLSLVTGKATELARVDRLRSTSLAPSGKWLVYYTAFSESNANGLWLMDTAGGRPKAAPKEAFGAYQWRATASGDQLVIVPFEPDASYHEFWQLDPQSMALKQLTQAEDAPIKIANGDWRVSPDGRYVTYVESKDRNIWVLALP